MSLQQKTFHSSKVLAFEVVKIEFMFSSSLVRSPSEKDSVSAPERDPQKMHTTVKPAAQLPPVSDL
jgi:hypothetical protein